MSTNRRFLRGPKGLDAKFNLLELYGDMPDLHRVDVDGVAELVPFNLLRAFKGDKATAVVHFFIDDYRFERMWTMPDRWLGELRQFAAVCSPDFSFDDWWPIPLQLYQIYRSRWVARHLHEAGIKVVPTLQWAGETSFEWCFDGIEPGGTVAVTGLEVSKSLAPRQEEFVLWHQRNVFLRGFELALEKVKPSRLLWYGPVPEWLKPNGFELQVFESLMAKRRAEWRQRPPADPVPTPAP